MVKSLWCFDLVVSWIGGGWNCGGWNGGGWNGGGWKGGGWIGGEWIGGGWNGKSGLCVVMASDVDVYYFV